MTRNDKWPEIPVDAAARRQEAEDRREMDKLEALLTPPPDPELERLIAEQEARARSRANADPEAMRRELEVRAGMLDPDEAGLNPRATSAEIAAEGRAAHWPQHLRQQYIRAIEREDAARAAGQTYGGTA